MSFEEQLKNTFNELESFNMEGVNTFRDFVDCMNMIDKRYVYKSRVKQIMVEAGKRLQTKSVKKTLNRIFKELGLEEEE